MKDKDLKMIGLVLCAVVALIAFRFPVASVFLVFGMWPCILFFDWLDNRGRSKFDVLKENYET